VTDRRPTAEANAIEIVIRPWAEGDLELAMRLLGDPAMTEHLGGPETPDQIRRRHGRYLAMTDPAEGQMLTVILRHSGTAVGSTGFWPHDDNGETVWETGWFVLPEYQGQGIATAATRLAVEAAWRAVRRPVHAFPNVENAVSNAIARKLGMRLIGPRDFEYPKGHWMTCNDWVIEPPSVHPGPIQRVARSPSPDPMSRSGARQPVPRRADAGRPLSRRSRASRAG
jgi:RimJ/RimL family protein N-acetyltransferase